MKVCYFGDYDSSYSRNRVIIKGLRENGVEILECHSNKEGIAKYADLYKKHKIIKNQYDLLIVAQSFNSRLVWLAKLISQKKIVWDIFYSFYDKYVFDSQVIRPWSLRGRYQWLREWLAGWLCDVALYDTNAYIDFFVKTFKTKREKFVRVLIGADSDFFSPKAKTNQEKDYFLIHFHGNFIPVQGIQYIIQAAKILETHEDIKFYLIGSGQQHKQMVTMAEGLSLKNVFFLGKKPFEQINDYLNEADISLGNFGDTDKTLRVVATKTYESIAAGIAVISADVPAMREIFIDGENMLFCKRADAKDLAEKILVLKNNSALREKIAQGGYSLYKDQCTPKVIVKKMLEDLEKNIKTKNKDAHD